VLSHGLAGSSGSVYDQNNQVGGIQRGCCAHIVF
jgi:hypothetical protein